MTGLHSEHSYRATSPEAKRELDIEIERVKECTNPSISVVIKSVPDRELQTLEYLENQSIDDFEIIVAVDSEIDDFRWAAANRGIEAANAEYVALTDDDTAPPPDWLATAVETFHSNPQTVLIEGPVDKLKDVSRNYVGCNLAARREAALKVGGFDQTFCSTYEGAFRGDTDFGWRMEKEYGVEACEYVPDWEIRHIGPLKGDYIEKYDMLLKDRHPERYDMIRQKEL